MAKPKENVIYRKAEIITESPQQIQIKLIVLGSTIKKWIKTSVEDMHVDIGT